MDELPSFLLFPNPQAEDVLSFKRGTCDVCGKARDVMYKGPVYGGRVGEHDFNVCPWCIADGSAGARGLVFNDLGPVPFGHAAIKLPQEEQELAERRTPGYVTWQGNHWMACCGHACVYLGEADREDLCGRWASGVPSMFEGEDRSQEEIDEIVNRVERGGSVCAYVFQCRHCGQLRAYWDCD